MGDGSEVCSEGGGKEESRFSDTNPNSEISRFRSGNFGFTLFISNGTLLGGRSRGRGLCGHYLKSLSSRFVDCSVRVFCDHSKTCEIEHELECGLREQVKTRSTSILG